MTVFPNVKNEKEWATIIANSDILTAGDFIEISSSGPPLVPGEIYTARLVYMNTLIPAINFKYFWLLKLNPIF